MWDFSRRKQLTWNGFAKESGEILNSQNGNEKILDRVKSDGVRIWTSIPPCEAILLGSILKENRVGNGRNWRRKIWNKIIEKVKGYQNTKIRILNWKSIIGFGFGL
jgi:hypothetical protein